MDPSSITPQQKLYAAAAANILFIISLFFPWFGVSLAGFSASSNGWDVVPSSWIFLILAGAAAAALLAAAFDRELPVRVPPVALAAYCSTIPFWMTVAIMFEGGGRKWGLFLAFIFSLVAAGLSVWLWRSDEV